MCNQSKWLRICGLSPKNFHFSSHFQHLHWAIQQIPSFLFSICHETFWILAHYPLGQEAQSPSDSQISFQLQTFPAVICCSFITSWSSSYTWFGSPNHAPSSIPWSLLQYPLGFKKKDWFHWVMCAYHGPFHLFWWSLIILKADSWHALQKAEEFTQDRHVLLDSCFSLASAHPVKTVPKGGFAILMFHSLISPHAAATV